MKFKFKGKGEDSPKKIMFMGEIKFILDGDWVDVQDEHKIKKLQGNDSFICEGESSIDLTTLKETTTDATGLVGSQEPAPEPTDTSTEDLEENVSDATQEELDSTPEEDKIGNLDLNDYEICLKFAIENKLELKSRKKKDVQDAITKALGA